VLVVEDDGGAIPGDQQEQLFQRFYRLDGAKASGSGLGLAIARELAELMNGTIGLESARGLTVFRLVLPVPQAEPPPISRENGAAAAREPTPAAP
jgi:signal transduction histidine kinase